MRSDGLSWGGVLARFVAALILVYATWNPEGISYYHWAIAPMVGDAPPATGSLALRFVAGILLAIGWVVFLQAARRSLGIAGAALSFALCAGVIWFLIEQRIVAPTSARAIGHIALVAVALVLAVGMSWSHVSRRLSGQLDTDEVN
jgi:hypothetical protein